MSNFWLAKKFKVDNLCFVSDFIFATIIFYVLMYFLRT